MSDRGGVFTDARGDAMQCRSGRPYYPMGPRPEDVRAADVSWALARAARFGGHTLRTYTVLEHEIRGCDLALSMSGWTAGALALNLSTVERKSALAQSWLTDLDLALAFLVHDSAEAYIADVTRPLKVNLPDYQRVERLSDEAVLAALLPRRVLERWHDAAAGDPATASSLRLATKRLDNLMLAAERRDLMVAEADGGLPWGALPEAPPVDFSAPVWCEEDARCAGVRDLGHQFAAAVGSWRVATAEHGHASAASLAACDATLRASADYHAALLAAAWHRRGRLLWALCADLGEPCPF